jgi:23S rRNA (cytosine1962-C5)-methyltransferase
MRLPQSEHERQYAFAACANISVMPKPRTTEEKIALAPPAAHGPAAIITRRAADKLHTGSLWIYRSDVSQLIPALGTEAPAPGELVTVLDNRGIPVGTALYSSASQITLRIVSGTPALTREQYLHDVRERVQQALALRKEILAESADTDACRLCFSEADNLPGILADRYNDLILLQLLTQGTAQDDVRAVLTEVLREEFKPAAIWERPDPRIRELEQLAPPAAGPLFASGKKAPKSATEFTLNGLQFRYDAGSGQKTGAFLDQRLNYMAAAFHAQKNALGRAGAAENRALDVCTYQGGFALHLARVCERVTGVDASRAALEVADANLELNRAKLLNNGNGVDWIEADAFELLREYEANGERFGTIVLDPPAFAKSKNATEGALRGYKEMNLRAIKMLEPGGTLVTCSCSHHVPLADFTAAIASAAADAGRRVRILERRAAAPDHPEIVTLLETVYLKCIIVQVLS